MQTGIAWKPAALPAASRGFRLGANTRAAGAIEDFDGALPDPTIDRRTIAGNALHRF
jgi:hypothetical protein